jgi:cytoskeletal protein RodZ
MSVQRTAGDLGTRLRTARERRGVTVQQLASATTISANAIEALERNDLSGLPGGIFSRAFVRSYAIEVGLDPDAAIEQFLEQFPPVAGTARRRIDQIEDRQAHQSDRRIAAAVLWLLVFSVPIAGLILYYGATGRPQTSSKPQVVTR